MKILVVEDDTLLLDAIRRKLEKEGESAVYYRTAKEALDHLEQNKESLPDVIWLDYYLPDMNGLEFAKVAKERYPTVPIVVVSNSTSDDKILAFKNLGVTNYILKADFELSQVVEKVREEAGKSQDK